MKFFFGNILLIVTASTGTLASHDAQHRLQANKFPFASTADHDASNHPSNPRCRQPAPLNPSRDGLSSSRSVFSGSKALELMVKRHQDLVRIPSVCYDDMGALDEDERWKPFAEIPKTLKNNYPNVYKHATLEKVNEYGLVYTIQGSEKELAPILLTAHQDVVPVNNETLDEWEHSPFDAHYDEREGYLWGRGASDDKSAITALMSAMEALLDQDEFKPRRTVLLAFGFDEECSGALGAGHISKYLEKTYGENGIAVILDEGGAGIQMLGDTLYALPAVYEKGYLDVWFDLSVAGGHSSAPTPHTAIGIMSEIVTTLEHNPFDPKIARNGPVHQGLVCLAQYSPYVFPDLTRQIQWGNLDGAAQVLAHISRETKYLIQTSQAVDWIAGGQKINALPEFVTLGVNHRYAPQDSIGSIQHRIANLVKSTVRNYNLKLEAFEDDEDYDHYLSSNGLSRQCHKEDTPQKHDYNGILKLHVKKKSYITPQSSTSGPVWDTFAGTVRHSYAREARNVVAAPGAMTGNTDTRHYLNLSRNIYRWSPGSLKSFSHIHGVNERLLMSEHINMAKFYYDFIRNFDQADI